MSRILLLSGDPAFKEKNIEILSQAGLEVAAAADCLQGLPLLNKDKYDIVIIDSELSDMSGSQACRIIREQSGVPIILLGTVAEPEIWAKAGFNAVDVPLSEMMTSLQTGLIDGFMDTPVFALSLQIFAKAPHMINMSFGIAIGATIIQKSQWNKIEPDLQKAFLKASQDLVVQSQAEVRSMDEKAITEMKKYGLLLTEVAPQDAASWIDPLQKIYPEIREKVIPKDIFDKTIELRNQYRSGKK